MAQLLIKLGSLLDELDQTGKAVITEKNNRLIVDGLAAQDVLELLAVEGDLERLELQDSEPSDVTDASSINATFEPYRIVWAHRHLPAETKAFLTTRGFREWCSSPCTTRHVWLAQLEQPFESFGVRFSPWADDTAFVPARIAAKPRRLVRDLSDGFRVPEQLGSYILRESSSPRLDNHLFVVWAQASALAVFHSLANEVETDGTLVFRSSPVVRARMPVNPIQAFDSGTFEHLQCLARWTFLSETEAETRHGLVVAEVARTGAAESDAGTLFASCAGSALEGAKIAHQFMVQKISGDSLKALSDLRKAVSDETSKLADSTRQLAAAVGTALFAGIGAVVTRLTVPLGSWPVAAALTVVGVVLCIYVAVVILSSSQFMRLQADLRTLWRSKLYRFLTDSDYAAMVGEPVKRAERTFRIATYVSWALTAALLTAAVAVAFEPVVQSQVSSKQSAVDSRPNDTLLTPPDVEPSAVKEQVVSPPGGSSLPGQPPQTPLSPAAEIPNKATTADEARQK